MWGRPHQNSIRPHRAKSGGDGAFQHIRGDAGVLADEGCGFRFTFLPTTRAAALLISAARRMVRSLPATPRAPSVPKNSAHVVSPYLLVLRSIKLSCSKSFICPMGWGIPKCSYARWVTHRPWGSWSKPDLHQIGFIHVLQGHRFLIDRRRQGIQPHRPAAVVADDGGQHPAVDGI